VITDSGGDLAATPTPTSPNRSPAASESEAHRETIELALSRGRNAMAIWQDLVDSVGFGAGYQSVRRYVAKLRGNQSAEPAVV
jgi:hypothetical protein